MQHERLYLSPPHLGSHERELVMDAIASNWIAPVGPHLESFESEFSELVGSKHAVALSSGTAALHLALQVAGVEAGDEVLVSTLTFVASANPIRYLGATPVFVDSDRATWNMDPTLLVNELNKCAKSNRLPKAVVVVHLYGQCADLEPIVSACRHHGVPLIEDAAEALGAKYCGRAPGTFGLAGVHSFNGNKIITTSGGGMLTTDDERFAVRVRKLATQARDPAPHYEHSEIGYNYRMSNVLAAIGRGQLQLLEERVEARRGNFDYYRQALGNMPGLEFMPESPNGRHTRWLTTLTLEPDAFGADREAVRIALEAQNIEARPVWKPMHRQPAFCGLRSVGGGVADKLFEHGLCLPSGSNLSRDQLRRVADAVVEASQQGRVAS